MRRAIAFHEVRKGDVVYKLQGGGITVRDIQFLHGHVVLSGPLTEVTTDDGGEVEGQITGEFLSEMLCIAGRPRTEGKTEDELIGELRQKMRHAFEDTYTDGRAEALHTLGDAIGEYELGLPQE